jgi:ABC-type proline/glycine betaine transport system permease subunit
MEKFDISAAAVVVHLLISWIPWLIGITVGGGLGALCALGIRAVLSARPVFRRPLVLLPWRTLVMGCLMATWSPFLVGLLGIGPITGGVMVGGSVCLLAMAFTAATLVENRHPSPLGVHLIAGTRTLAVASGLIAAGVGLLGGGGLGYTVMEATRLQQYGLMWKGLLVILVMALILDLALGLAQMIALQHSGDSSESAIAGELAA